jgi:hypothetical protein
MKKYLLIAIILLLISCSEDDSPKEYNYFPFETKIQYLQDVDGGEIRLAQAKGSDIEESTIKIGRHDFKIFDEELYYSVYFNTEFIYFIAIRNNNSSYDVNFYDKNGDKKKYVKVDKTTPLNFISVTSDFGIYIEDKAGITEISYKGNLFY